MWETATEGIDGDWDGDGERETGGWAGGGHCWSPSVSSLSVSYVIHMIHVEPRGAGITLTFCIQHTHTLPTNTKEMCPQIPSPRALCTLFVCVIFPCVCVCVRHILGLYVDVVHVTYSIRLYPKIWEKTDPILTMFVTVGALRRDKCVLKIFFFVQYPWCTCAFKTASQLMEKDRSFSRLHH